MSRGARRARAAATPPWWDARTLRRDSTRPAGYSLGLHAFAKVNLSLRVGPRRDDGYHEIDTILQTIDFADTLYARPRARGLRLRIRREGPARAFGTAVRARDNLVLRAATTLRRTLGETDGADLLLVKRVPAGAGLGGGSSDAAATLRVLARLWRRAVPVDLRDRLLRALGSDCAFFWRGGRARATGRGERLRSLRVPARAVPLWVAIPKVGVATAEAYRWLDEDRARVRKSGRRFGLTASEGASRIGTHSLSSAFTTRARDGNDFEEVVSGQRSEIEEMKQLLRDWGGRNPRLSGSGSAVFAELPRAMPPAHVVTRRRPLPFSVVLARLTRVGSLWCR